jgi:hypothetical protein
MESVSPTDKVCAKAYQFAWAALGKRLGRSTDKFFI